MLFSGSEQSGARPPSSLTRTAKARALLASKVEPCQRGLQKWGVASSFDCEWWQTTVLLQCKVAGRTWSTLCQRRVTHLARVSHPVAE